MSREQRRAPDLQELPWPLDVAARLVDDLADASRREADAFSEGYGLGFRTGYDVGWSHAEHDMSKAWAEMARKVRALAGQPTGRELRRYPDPRPRPGDYRGGAVDFETGRPLRAVGVTT